MIVRLLPLADQDIEEIWRFVARDSVAAADHVEARIHAAMQLLAEFPGMGHRRPDVSDPRYRFWRVHSYLIVYRVEADAIVVVRVLHGAREVAHGISSVD